MAFSVPTLAIKYGLFLAAALALATSEANAACSDFAINFGKLKRIYPAGTSATGPGTFFQLKNGSTGALSGSNPYYFIPATGAPAVVEAYRSEHDLLVEAAKAGWTVYVRTTNCGTVATVAYIFVDY